MTPTKKGDESLDDAYDRLEESIERLSALISSLQDEVKEIRTKVELSSRLLDELRHSIQGDPLGSGSLAMLLRTIDERAKAGESLAVAAAEKVSALEKRAYDADKSLASGRLQLALAFLSAGVAIACALIAYWSKKP